MNDYNKDNIEGSFAFWPIGDDNAICNQIWSLLQAIIKLGKKWDEEVPAEFHTDL